MIRFELVINSHSEYSVIISDVYPIAGGFNDFLSLLNFIRGYLKSRIINIMYIHDRIYGLNFYFNSSDIKLLQEILNKKNIKYYENIIYCMFLEERKI